jgi:hypothetical protein
LTIWLEYNSIWANSVAEIEILFEKVNACPASKRFVGGPAELGFTDFIHGENFNDERQKVENSGCG